MCVLEENIYVLDGLNNAIRKVSPAEQKVTTLEILDSGGFFPFIRSSEMTKRIEKVKLLNGKNMIVLELMPPEQEEFSGQEIIIEKKGESLGEVVNVDSKNGLVMIKVDIEEFELNMSYLSMEFFTRKKEAPSHKYKYGIRVLLEYIETENPQEVGPVKIQL